MSYSKKNLIAPVIATLVFVMLFAATWVGSATSLDVGYSYESVVGSHFDRAAQGQTPEVIIEEIDLALEGIEELGLEGGVSARWFWWEQTPNHDVEWTIQYLNDVRDRAVDVIEWRDAIFEDNTSNELMRDVYEDKVRHLRQKFDYYASPLWIVPSAHYRVNHALYYWVWLWLPVLWFFMVVSLLLALVIDYCAWDEWRRDRGRRRDRIEEERDYQSFPGYPQARCPQCGHSNSIPSHMSGEMSVRCSHCRTHFNHTPERTTRVD